MSADHIQIDPDVNVSSELILAHYRDRVNCVPDDQARALRREESRILARIQEPIQMISL